MAEQVGAYVELRRRKGLELGEDELFELLVGECYWPRPPEAALVALACFGRAGRDSNGGLLLSEVREFYEGHGIDDPGVRDGIDYFLRELEAERAVVMDEQTEETERD